MIWIPQGGTFTWTQIKTKQNMNTGLYYAYEYYCITARVSSESLQWIYQIDVTTEIKFFGEIKLLCVHTQLGFFLQIMLITILTILLRQCW